ncbi:MAG: ThiF family adenylyltransferase [Planctomycetia bacterium]|nr:ThiF family adenylyltransferase [Planctomycetia bacterium]
MPDDPQSAERSDPLARYARQSRFAPLGEAGQRRLLSSTVFLCGCGALGTVLANTLVRAGVGRLRIVDRDFVETTNLQRQVLFDEDDVAAQLPKSVAAAEKLRRINSTVEIEAIVADVDAGNVEGFAAGADVMLDGTDNFETRFLLNDVAVKHGIPWVYGGCLGAEGQTMTILPGETPCLRCLIPEPPPPGVTPTCDTAGILAPIINVIASIEAAEAMKILAGQRAAISRTLQVFDLWENRCRQLDISKLRGEEDCPCCGKHEFEWLAGDRASQSTVLCGRNSVQVAPPPGWGLSLEELERKLSGVGNLMRNPFLLRLQVEPYQVTVFADGRAIISGTDDPAAAKTIYARYVGN